MNLTEMVTSLVEDTKLVIYKNELTRRVREAITGIHSSAFYDRDLVEDVISLGASNTHTNFQIALPVRFREFKCIKPMSDLNMPMCITTKNGQYAETEASFTRNYYNETIKDYYYIAGAVINVSSTVAPAKLYLQWYELPEVADPLLETWLMREYPQIIMDWALARFWKVHGKEQIASTIERTLYSVDVQNIINNHATSVG